MAIRRETLGACALVAALGAAPGAQADWKKLLEGTIGGGTASSTGAAALTEQEITGGLKEALAQGAERAVAALGRRDGFLGNEQVRIPLPERLQGVGRVLGAMGQQHRVDELVTTMNRAAEAAVPEAGPILGDAIRDITLEDARRILDGPDDAATQYFRRAGEQRLTERLRPLVSDATDRAGVTAAYKQLVDRAGSAAALVDSRALDLDGYVTGKALDGLFLMIAAQEKRIRDNPAARGTELLQKVFGGGGASIGR